MVTAEDRNAKPALHKQIYSSASSASRFSERNSKGRLLFAFDKEALPFAQAQHCEQAAGML
jgi:hypothetical protein